MEKNIIKFFLIYLFTAFITCDEFVDLKSKNFKHDVYLPFDVKSIIFLSKSDFKENKANLFFYVTNNSMTLHLNSMDEGNVYYFNDVWAYIKEFNYNSYQSIEFYFIYYEQRIDLHGRLKQYNYEIQDKKIASLRYKTSVHKNL